MIQLDQDAIYRLSRGPRPREHLIAVHVRPDRYRELWLWRADSTGLTVAYDWLLAQGVASDKLEDLELLDEGTALRVGDKRFALADLEAQS